MKKIFTALAVMAMAVTGAGYAQANDGRHMHNQPHIEYKHHNNNCGPNFQGHGPKHHGPQFHGPKHHEPKFHPAPRHHHGHGHHDFWIGFLGPCFGGYVHR